MACGADSIDDANVLRAGGTPRVFNEVYAPSTLGIFLREFTFGHAKQLAAVARAHLVATGGAPPAAAGRERAFLDIDSLLRPVYGHPKQGASLGTPRSPAARCCVWACHRDHHPLHGQCRAGHRRGQLRSGKAASGRAGARPVKQAITTAKAINPDATIMVRGDSMFGCDSLSRPEGDGLGGPILGGGRVLL